MGMTVQELIERLYRGENHRQFRGPSLLPFGEVLRNSPSKPSRAPHARELLLFRGGCRVGPG